MPTTPKSTSYTRALATLGERWQDTGNGSISVTTHAGLTVTLTIKEKHPSETAQRLLIQAVDAKRMRRGLLSVHGERAKAQQELVRRKLVEITPGIFRVLTPTKAGRIAARRFRAMLLQARKRALRAKRAADR